METNTFVINLVICFLLSFMIGIERQYRRRIVGLRTTILVCVGSFLFVSASFIIGGNKTDLTRIAAQVVSGIGFLGAGVIIKDGMKVRGLTTAATMWCDASIGVLCATGASIPAILGTFVILFSNTVLRYLNKEINRISTNKRICEQYLIKIEANNKNILDIKNFLYKKLKNEFLSDIIIDDIKLNLSSRNSNINLLLTIKKNKAILLDKIVEDISKKFSTDKIVFKMEKEIVNVDEEEIM